ncbi:MAG: MFS transporter [Candidatus Dormibacteraeota bacterium]|jgi:EmrB/QacA subfamily drug resistance transporter|nr:MFS transporter [Candidatus Dormibacteraeota bacterium]
MSTTTREQETSIPSAGPSPLSSRARWAVMAAILLTMFMGSLDQTVVGTALPRIVTDLSGNSLYSWVVTAYLLSSTITVPIYGKFSDVFGRKPMLLVGVGLFLVGSWACGFSQNMGELIVFRALQGLGAGAIFPIALAVIGDLFSARERGRYQGLFGAVFGLSFIVGPFVGGWLTDNVSWRWVFYVNLPVGIAALAVITYVMPSLGRRGASALDLDYLGIALFCLGVIPLLIGLTNKGQTDSSGRLYDWTAPSVGGLILGGLLVLAVFVFVEWRAREPIVPLDLFRSRDYTASQVAVFLFAVGMFTAVIFLPRYYQAARGDTATQSGYEIWPLLVGLIGGSTGSGILISRIGRYKWILVASAVPLIVGGYLMTHLTASTGTWTLWLWMLILGLGVGPSLAGFTVAVQNVVPLDRLGVATSNLTFFRQIGGSVGLAVADTVFASAFTNRLPNALTSRGLPATVVHQLVAQGQALTGVGGGSGSLAQALPAQLRPLLPQIEAGIQDALAAAVAELFWITIVAGLLALACTLVLRDVTLRSGQDRRRESLTAEEASAPAPAAHL